MPNKSSKSEFTHEQLKELWKVISLCWSSDKRTVKNELMRVAPDELIESLVVCLDHKISRDNIGKIVNGSDANTTLMQEIMREPDSIKGVNVLMQFYKPLILRRLNDKEVGSVFTRVYSFLKLDDERLTSLSADDLKGRGDLQKIMTKRIVFCMLGNPRNLKYGLASATELRNRTDYHPTVPAASLPEVETYRQQRKGAAKAAPMGYDPKKSSPSQGGLKLARQLSEGSLAAAAGELGQVDEVFLKHHFTQNLPSSSAELMKIIQSMGLSTEEFICMPPQAQISQVASTVLETLGSFNCSVTATQAQECKLIYAPLVLEAGHKWAITSKNELYYFNTQTGKRFAVPKSLLPDTAMLPGKVRLLTLNATALAALEPMEVSRVDGGLHASGAWVEDDPSFQWGVSDQKTGYYHPSNLYDHGWGEHDHWFEAPSAIPGVNGTAMCQLPYDHRGGHHWGSGWEVVEKGTVLPQQLQWDSHVPSKEFSAEAAGVGMMPLTPQQELLVPMRHDSQVNEVSMPMGLHAERGAAGDSDYDTLPRVPFDGIQGAVGVHSLCVAPQFCEPLYARAAGAGMQYGAGVYGTGLQPDPSYGITGAGGGLPAGHFVYDDRQLQQPPLFSSGQYGPSMSDSGLGSRERVSNQAQGPQSRPAYANQTAMAVEGAQRRPCQADSASKRQKVDPFNERAGGGISDPLSVKSQGQVVRQIGLFSGGRAGNTEPACSTRPACYQR